MDTLKRNNSDSHSQEPRKKAKSFDTGLKSADLSNSTEQNKKHFIFKKTSSAPSTIETLMQNELMSSDAHRSHSINNMKIGNDEVLDVQTDRVCSEKSEVIPRRVSSRRKFPGPAGLLPEQRNGSELEIEDHDILPRVGEINIQASGSWEKMLADYPAVCDRVNLTEKYNIQWIKNRVLAKDLINQRTPFLAAFIHSIDCNTTPDAMVNVVLKDKSGTIQGTISPKLYEQYFNELTVGAVVVLKQIGVLNAGLSTEPYLIISLKNLISIYTKYNKGNSNLELTNEISRIIVRETSIDEIYKIIEQMNCDNPLRKTTGKPPGYNNSNKNDILRSNTNGNNFQHTKTTTSNNIFCDKDDEIDELMIQFLEKTENSTVQQGDTNISKENMIDATCSNASENRQKLHSTNSPKTDMAKDNHGIVLDMFEGLDTNLLFEDF